MNNTIPKRSEVPEEYTWNLKDLFESDEAWLSEYEALKALPAKFPEYAGKISQSADMLLEFLKLQDEVNLRARKLMCYANCSGDVDTGNNFFGFERFDDVVVSTDIQTENAVEHLALGRKHNDGRLRGLTDLAAHLPSVKIGHHNIEQHQIGRLFGKQVECLPAVTCYDDRKARLFKI